MIRAPSCAVAALFALALTGCASVADTGVGFGLGALSAEASATALGRAGVQDSPLTGALTVRDDGCFAWSGEDADGAWIVWPESASLAEEDASSVILSAGRVVSDGMVLSGRGALVGLADLPDGENPDSYFGMFGRFCDADTRGVLVVVSIDTIK